MNAPNQEGHTNRVNNQADLPDKTPRIFGFPGDDHLEVSKLFFATFTNTEDIYSYLFMQHCFFLKMFFHSFSLPFSSSNFYSLLASGRLPGYGVGREHGIPFE